MSLLLRGGLIVDGTGRPPYWGDVWIERDVIRAVGDLPQAKAREAIDASGLVVSPGFIDCHTHSDFSLMQNRQHPHAIYSGISTLVVGQCGLGFAPMAEADFDRSIRMHAGIFGDPRAYAPRWSGFASFLHLLDGCAVNVAACVTHNAVRQAGAGFSDAPLTGIALERALEALDTALSEGAVGLSLGLSYYPGSFSDTAELIALCRVLAKHDGLLCVHARLLPEPPDYDPLREMAVVVSQTGVRLHMLHHRTLPTGTMGHVDRILSPFDDCIRDGAKVSFEYYPYLAGAGYALVMLPGWVQEGGPEAILERLTAPDLRARLLHDMEERLPRILRPGVRGVVSATRDPYDPALGRSFDEIAAERGLSICETVVELLVENDLELGFHETEPEDPAVRAQLFDDQFEMFSNPRYTIGSDTIPFGEFCHPRAFGTYPRVLRQMLDRGMKLETLVQKLTAFPASLYRLNDRGALAEGMKADVCLWDPKAVRDTATFERPRSKPEGIHTLVVNGKIALREGGITGLLPGRALEAPKD